MNNPSIKELHLLRHAKSSWDNPALADIDRPLNSRGEKACRTMAKQIYQAGGLNGSHSIYCSPAVRALQTIVGISNTLENQFTWQTKPSLYTFNWRDIVRFCQQLDDDEQCATVIGHNPALHETIECLTGETIEKFPTCAYAKLRCNISSWQDLAPSCASLKAYYFPKMF